MADEKDLSYWRERTREHGGAGVGYNCSEKLIRLDNIVRGRAISQFVKFRPGMRVLDVGTASGYWAIRAAMKGAEVTGLDFNQDILEIADERAREAGVKITWVDGALEDAGFSDESFDAVLSITCLQHITDPERQKKAIQVILRSLKPNGVFVLLEDTKPPNQAKNEYLLSSTQQQWIDLVKSQGARLIGYTGVSFVRFKWRKVPAVCAGVDYVLGTIPGLRHRAKVTAFAFGVAR